MWRGQQSTDYNGIVLFDPDRLREFYGGRIRKGTNLFARFMKTEDGDEVLKHGVIVPVLAIDDAGYTIVVRDEHERSPVEPWVVVTNGVFPFHVRIEAVLADLAVFATGTRSQAGQDEAQDPGRGLRVRPLARSAPTSRHRRDRQEHAHLEARPTEA